MSSTTSHLAIIKSTTEEEEEHKEEQSREEEEKEEEKADNNLHPQEGDQRRLAVMSLHGVVQPPPLPPPSSPPPQSPSSHHLPGALLDEISSPINSQIFDFCNPDIFSETLQNSDAASSPDGCVFENHNSSTYVTNLSLPLVTVENDDNNSDSKFNIESLDISNFLGDQNDHNTSTTSSTTTTAATTATNPSAFQNGLSIIFDSPDDIDDISASIDFSSSSPFSGPPPYTINPNTTTTTQQDQYQIPLDDGISPYPTSIGHTTLLPLISSPPPPLGPIFEEECLSPILPFLRLNTTNASFSSCGSFVDHPSIGGSFMHGNPNHGLGVENSTMFSGSSFMASELQGKELDFQGDSGGIFCPDQLTRVYSSGDKRPYSNESSQLVGVATTSSAPLATEITSVEDSSFKVGKLSTEQRKEKIHRYMKKRNERNFSKKIKYACRKTLADSRPRVRGRFAKNDDFMETHRSIKGHHDDDDYDDVAMVKEEHDLVDSDIFSHISGVNSFKCNYQIQSWI